MNRATWEASTPKCPRDGEPLLYSAEWNRWVCLHHGVERDGGLLAREAGFDVSMHYAAEEAA